MLENTRLLSDRILVERLESETIKNGIIIPDKAQEKEQRGKVLAVGPGARDEKGEIRPMSVKAGDIVLFGKFTGTEHVSAGDGKLFMREGDVLAVVEPD